MVRWMVPQISMIAMNLSRGGGRYVYRWPKKTNKGIYQWSVTILDLSNHLPKAQLRATLSPFQTSFNPYLYSSGSSSVGSALWKVATTRSFILNRDIVADIMSSTSSEPGLCAVHSAPSRLLSASLQMGLHACGDQWRI